MESKTKTEFMNRMSHDLRTPINGILGMIHVIRKSWNNQEKLEDSVDKIEISTRHLMDLVNDVLDMSKLESGHLTVHEEPFDLEDLMKEVAVLMQGQLEETGRTGAGAGRCRSRWYFGMSFQTAGDKRLLRADV